MRQLIKFIPIVAILLFTGCSGDSEYARFRQDSIRIVDSLYEIYATETAGREKMEESGNESIIAQESPYYDQWISKCESLANQLLKLGNEYKNQIENYDNYDYYDEFDLDYFSDLNAKYIETYDKILKSIDNFTPEQFSRVQKFEKVYNKVPFGYFWG